MTPFYRSFLLDSGRSRYLAVFGKHPAWDDHMDDIGVATESLVTLKRILYLEGIARNISSGIWQLQPGTYPPFDHLFRWQRDNQVLLGRIQASSDRKGRTFFPLIVCAHILDAPSSLEVEACVDQSLEQIYTATCTEAVQEVVASQLSALRDLPEQPDPPADLEIDSLLDQAGLDLTPFSPRKFHPKKSPAAQRFRAARSSDPIPLERWIQAMRRTKIHPGVPILILAPRSPDSEWLDVIIGEPSPSDFACLLR